MHPPKWDYWSLSTITFIDFISNFSLRKFLWWGTQLHSMWDLSSLTRDRTQATGVKVLIPNHWTIRKFPFRKTLWACKILFAPLSHCPANLLYIILFIFVYIMYNKEYLLWASPLIYISVALIKLINLIFILCANDLLIFFGQSFYGEEILILPIVIFFTFVYSNYTHHIYFAHLS